MDAALSDGGDASRIYVMIARPKEADECDGYVKAISARHGYHQWVWREVVEATFQHQPYYLAARQSGVIRGVLPLFLIRSRLFGHALISLPFFSYGGLLADNADIAGELLGAASILSLELGARYVELRQGEALPTGTEDTKAWPRTACKVTMEIQLPPSTDEYLARLSPSRRKRLRYVLRNRFHSQWGGLEALNVFYRIFAINMRNLGTPVYPLKFFAEQLSRMPERIRILTLYDGATPLAAAFLTAHGDTLEMPWAASLPESHRKEAPTVLYWTIIQRAIEEGFQKVDFGRCTPGSGNYHFKRHWRPVERPLYWYYWLRSGASVPDRHPDNPALSLAISLWKRLPLAFANRIGPRLVRSLP